MSQQRARAVVVTDPQGVRGLIDAAARDNSGQVLVHLENGRQALIPADELLRQPDGSFTLRFTFEELTRENEELIPVGTRSREAGARGDASLVVPVVAEQLDVQKRRVESGGVRIRKVVREREEIVDEPLIREEVQVKRVPVNRVVDGPVPVRHVGDTMIISLLEEVLVVEKRLMLKEELHVTKTEVETYKPQRVLLRSEEATVERVGDARDSEPEAGGVEPPPG